MELLQEAASRMITVMNHTSKDDIKIYTDKYLRLKSDRAGAFRLRQAFAPIFFDDLGD